MVQTGKLICSYSSEARTCKIQYNKSNGMFQELSLCEISTRLFKLSFDPYHCIERRWGATTEADLASCTDGIVKSNWYSAEQRLRKQIDRTYGKRMDFSLNELRRALPGSSLDQLPDIDVHKVLELKKLWDKVSLIE